MTHVDDEVGRPAHFADAILVFSTAVGAMLVVVVARAMWAREAPLWVRQMLPVAMQLAWIALPFAYCRVAGVRVRETLLLRAPAASAWPRLFVVWLAMSWLTMGLHYGQTALFDRLGWDFGPQTRGVRETLEELGRWGPGFVILVVVVLTALGEELVFRGPVLGGFSRSFGGTRGTLYSSLLFAIAHLSVPRMTITFFLAVVFALAVRWTGSLWAGVALHSMNNLWALYFGPAFDGPPNPWATALAIATFGLAMASLRASGKSGSTAPPPSAGTPPDSASTTRGARSDS